MKISQKSNGDLFVLLALVMQELKTRNLVRTANNPVADLGELLFCGGLGWQREHNQGKDIDAIMKNGERVQIKARRLTRKNQSTRSGTIYDKQGWDWIALALFDTDFTIQKAILIPRKIALAHMKWSKRQQGWYISLTKTRFWKETTLIDVTPKLERYAKKLFLQSSA
jgi:hypothetical protein